MLIGWDELALQLSEYGFRPVFYFEICCPTDGTWRVCGRGTIMAGARTAIVPYVSAGVRDLSIPVSRFYAPGTSEAKKLMGALGVVRKTGFGRCGTRL
jgi:hypothetical protein